MARRPIKRTKQKIKKWYEVVAPELFEEKTISEIPGVDDKSLLNRVVKMSLADITGKFDENGLYTNVWLQIDAVNGNRALTRIKGYEMMRSYVKTVVRRRRTTVDDVFNIKTKDNVLLKIKPIIITAHRVSRSAQTGIRLAVRETAKKLASEKSFNEVMKALLFGLFANELKNTAKKIVPIDRAIVRRVDVMK